ncbi:hypothetical protein GCM10027564_14360 [Luteimonas notoginsengisoli]
MGALDIIAGVGFIAYSTYNLPTEPSWTDAAVLGRIPVGTASPFATGLNAACRAAFDGAVLLAKYG